MYPTMVIILVNHQRSFVDAYNFNSRTKGQDGETTVGQLAFAVPPTQSTQSTASTGLSPIGSSQMTWAGDSRVESDLEKAEVGGKDEDGLDRPISVVFHKT